MNNDNILFDLLKELREGQKEQNKELSEHGRVLAQQKISIANIQKSLEETKEDIKILKDNMAEHMRRTHAVETLVSFHQKRIESLEKFFDKVYDKVDSIEDEQETNNKIKFWVKDNFKWLLTSFAAIIAIAASFFNLK